MQTWVIVLIVLLLLGGVWWWMDRQKKKPPPPPGPQPTPTNRLSPAQLHQYAVAAMAGDGATCQSLLQQWGVPTGSYTTPAGFNYMAAWQALSWLSTEQLSVLNGLRLTSNPNCRSRLIHWGVYHDFTDSTGNFDCGAAYAYYSAL